MTRPLPIAACLALAALSFTAPAQEPPAPTPAIVAASTTPAGNADKGRMLTYTCQGCHGIAGYKNAYPNYHVPLIGGQSAVYLFNSLIEYRKGNRRHPTMQAQAQSFSDQDIADIAAFLAELTP
ncbi:cytochrome c [soil metagenome]